MPCSDDPVLTRQSRRLVVRTLGLGAAAGLLLDVTMLAGCGEPEPAAPAAVAIPIDRLADGQRVVVKVGTDTVEVRREPEGFVARSMVCTHQGCIVQWQEANRRYKCPCQEAWFDADGRPVQGPATIPLRRVSFRATEREVIVGADDAVRTAS